MSSRTILTLISGGRVVAGLVMLLAPKFMGERWLGAGGTDAESTALMRVGGVRDAAFGVGALVAAQTGADPRPWHAAAVVIDGTDAYATLSADGVPNSNKVPAAAIALGAALTSLAALLLAADDD